MNVLVAREDFHEGRSVWDILVRVNVHEEGGLPGEPCFPQAQARVAPLPGRTATTPSWEIKAFKLMPTNR